MTKTENQRCGFIALLGAPNAGKSTLVNTLTGSKVSIVSPRPGTTRSRIIAIMMIGTAQVVLVDLPGIFTAKSKLQRVMVETAWEEARGADAVFVLVDATQKGRAPDTTTILDWLTEQKRTATLVLNKIDACDKDRLLGLAKEYFATGLFTDVLMVSAKTGDGLDKLREMAAAIAPVGPWQYPEDILSDISERLWASEITREQVFLQLQQELPYAAAVETETWEERSKKLVAIGQVIYVQRETQRAIVLGKGGSRIKEIGTNARLEMEKELGRKVHLTLHVKVKANWDEDSSFLREQGLMPQ